MSGGRTRGDRGVVFILMALSMIGLLAITALVLDIGNQRQTKRRAQNALDAAALAGASVFDFDETVITSTEATQARAKAKTMLGVNSFDNLVATGDPNIFTCGNGEDCTIRLVPRIHESKQCIEVTIERLKVNTTFARAIGVNTLDVGTTSYGCKRILPFTGITVGAGFATGPCSAKTHESFMTNGANNRFEGSIHSSGGFEDSGGGDTRTNGDGTITSPLTSTATYEVDSSSNNPGSGNLWSGRQRVSTPTPPLPTVSQYAPGSATVPGTPAFLANQVGLYHQYSSAKEFAGPTSAGVHYVNGKVNIKPGFSVTPTTGTDGIVYRGATFVNVNELMDIEPDNATLIPFERDPYRIVFLPGWNKDAGPEDCDVPVFTSNSADCFRFDGFIFAPAGRLQFGGSGNGHSFAPGYGSCTNGSSTFRGGLIGWSIQVNGNYNLVRVGPFGGGSPTAEEFLGL